MRKLFIMIALSTSLLAGNIKIAVAANVSYAIKALTQEFKRQYPDINVLVTLGSSGKLTAQIMHGAPYALFMSADMRYPETLYKKGLAISKPLVYAQGTLAYIFSKKHDSSKGIKSVLDSTIKKIAVANPRTAPYGIATTEALKNAGFYKDVVDKFVYGESISQTLSFALHAADMGFVAKSSLFASSMSHYQKGRDWEDVPTTLYTPINQGVVILQKGKERSDVEKFYQFLLSDKAKNIFKSYGYLLL